MYGYQPMFPASYRREVIRVNGRGGVDAYRMPPNSSELLLDETAPLVWLVQTDGAGYKTATAFDLTPLLWSQSCEVRDGQAYER